MMVNRGPQFVQLVKGYRYLRSGGLKTSCWQGSQVAMSGEISWYFPASSTLSRISKERKPTGVKSSNFRDSIRARGGACGDTSRVKSSTASIFPSTSMNTPADELFTHPCKLFFWASPYTKGRKPTPWTTPFSKKRLLRRSAPVPTAFLVSSAGFSNSKFITDDLATEGPENTEFF